MFVWIHMDEIVCRTSLEFLGEVKESTGRSDDFCALAMPVAPSLHWGIKRLSAAGELAAPAQAPLGERSQASR
jgi:hypothetical protein